jgi:hypothetical protein
MRSMSRRGGYGIASGVLAATMTIAAPVVAHATMTGACTATALAASSGIDVTTQTIWHVRSSDIIVGAARATTPQTHVRVSVELFGVPISFAPVVERHGGGNKTGSGGYIRVADFSRYTRVFAIHGDADTCSGSLVLVIDDVSALGSLIGIISAILGLLGLLGLLWAAFMRRPVFGRVFGAVAGFFGGFGIAEFLQQTGFLDPTSLLDLAIPIAGILAGILIAGTLASSAALPAGRQPAR